MKISSSNVSGKHYSHNYRMTNSTTANFSFVQPLMCRMMLPNSTIKGRLASFVRLAPMPFPTFGDLRFRTIARFIPIEDVYPAFASFMSQKPYNAYSPDTSSAYVPNQVFFCTNRVLQNRIIGYSSNLYTSRTYTIPVVSSLSLESSQNLDFESEDLSKAVPMSFDEYMQRFKDEILENDTATLRVYHDEDTLAYECNVYSSDIASLVKAVVDGSKTFEEASAEYDSYFVSSDVSVHATSTPSDVLEAINSADYVLVNNTGDSSLSTVVVYKYNDYGKNLRKIFLGLGYNPSMDDTTAVSLLPLFAYYKAYFDEFYPNRGSLDWASSNCMRLINYCTQKGIFNINTSVNSDLSSLVSSFFQDLAETFVCKDSDWLSLHRNRLYDSNDTLVNNTSVFPPGSYIPSSPITINGTSDTIGQPNNNQTSSPNTSDGLSTNVFRSTPPFIPPSGAITNVTLRLLSKITSMFDRDSLIGNRVQQWMRSHVDSSVLERIYAQTYRVSSNDIQIQICDVDSNTDSYTSADIGARLGAYAGKGVGKGDMSFRYTSDTFGFFIIFGCIVAETSFYQGTFAQNLAVYPYQFPRSEFDGLGYEITPFTAIFTDNKISVYNDVSKRPSNTTANVNCPGSSIGFGYIPRYSGFKYAKNIVNGDLNLGSTSNSYVGYYLDREFTNRVVGTSLSSPTSLSVSKSMLPTATTEYQYQQKYSFMGYYDRIFYNMGTTGLNNNIPASSPVFSLHYDNFVIHNVIDFTELNALKPLSMSYSTQMDSSDEGSTVRV